MWHLGLLDMCNVRYSRWQHALSWFTHHRYIHREEETTYCCYPAGLHLFIFTAFSVSTPAQNTSFLLFWRYQQRTSCRLSVFNVLCVAQIAEPGHTWSMLTHEACLLVKCAQISNTCDHTYQINWGPGHYFDNVRSGFPRFSCFGWPNSGLFIFIKHGSEKESKNNFSLP